MEPHLHPDDLKKFLEMYYDNPDGYTEPEEYAALSVYRRRLVNNPCEDYVVETWHSCHAKIMGYISHGFKSFVTYVNAASEDHEEYIRDVLSPTGHWGSVLPEGCWDYVIEKDKWIGVSFKFDNVMADRAGVFYNMLVSLRQAAEHSLIVGMYKKLKQDFGESEAFFIVHGIQNDDDEIARFVVLQACHQSFNNQASLKLFKSKTPRRASPNSHSNIWGVESMTRMLTYDEIKSLYVRADADYGETLTYEKVKPLAEKALSFYLEG